MKNDELKALYEEFPWAWVIQRNNGNGWERGVVSIWWGEQRYRLKPNLPADLPEPTEDMMNRSVPLGWGPIKLPKDVSGFSSKAYRGGGWKAWSFNGGTEDSVFYCIDINDENAREIIALNRAEDAGRNPDTEPLVEQFRRAINITSRESASNTPDYLLAEYLESALQAYERAVSTRDERHPVVPPGESQWLRLGECEFGFKEPGSSYDIYRKVDADTALLYAIKHGLASVRVRKKRSDR